MHETETSKWCLCRINKLCVRIESLPSWPQLYKHSQVPTEVVGGRVPSSDPDAHGDLQLHPLEGENCGRMDAEERSRSWEIGPIPSTFSHNK